MDARQELAEAEAELAALLAPTDGVSPSPPPAPIASPTPLVPEQTVARVQQAETELATAQAGISDVTPLREASERFNAAAVALEVAWLQLLAQAGCLTDDQLKQATTGVRDYSVAFQQAVTDAGYFDGEVDGVYGPETCHTPSPHCKQPRRSRECAEFLLERCQRVGERGCPLPVHGPVPVADELQRLLERCGRRDRNLRGGPAAAGIHGETASRSPAGDSAAPICSCSPRRTGDRRHPRPATRLEPVAGRLRQRLAGHGDELSTDDAGVAADVEALGMLLASGLAQAAAFLGLPCEHFQRLAGGRGPISFTPLAA